MSFVAKQIRKDVWLLRGAILVGQGWPNSMYVMGLGFIAQHSNPDVINLVKPYDLSQEDLAEVTKEALAWAKGKANV